VISASRLSDNMLATHFAHHVGKELIADGVRIRGPKAYDDALRCR